IGRLRASPDTGRRVAPETGAGTTGAGPEAIGVGQQLRESIGSLPRQSAAITFFDPDHPGVIARMAAVVAPAGPGIDLAVLRVWQEGLSDRGAVAVQRSE